MSFILDALRKSENERRLETSPGIMQAPPAVPRDRLPFWAILAMGGLTVALIAVVLYSVFDRSSEPAASTRVEQPAPQAPAAALPEPEPAAAVDVEPSPAPVVTAAPLPEPASVPSAPVPAPSSAPAAAVAAPPPAASAPAAAEPVAVAPAAAAAPAASPTPAQTDISSLPAYAAVLAEGIGLSALQMQLHVHSSAPASRFVVINGSRYGEGDRLSEGPRVEEIAVEGAILSYNGRRFLLTPN